MAARADTSCSTVLLRAAVVVTSCSTALLRAAMVAPADTSCSTVLLRAAMVAPVELLHQWQNQRKKIKKQNLRKLLN